MTFWVTDDVKDFPEIDEIAQIAQNPFRMQGNVVKLIKWIKHVKSICFDVFYGLLLKKNKQF